MSKVPVNDLWIVDQKKVPFRMTWEKFVAWVIFWLIVTGVIVMLICGCAGGGYSSYEPVLQTSSYDHASEPLPPSQPQTVWVRTLGQPDQLVTVIPAY